MSENTRMQIGKFYETSKKAKYTQENASHKKFIFIMDGIYKEKQEGNKMLKQELDLHNECGKMDSLVHW